MNKKILFLAPLIILVFLFSFLWSSKPPFKHVILIAVDTLNAHHLGAYGAEKSPSPNLDKLAAEGVVFERAYSPSSWTKPTFSSIFTGLYPSVHGVTSFDKALPGEFYTLGEFFKDNGFSTGGVISHILLQSKFGYNQGFDYYGISFEGKKGFKAIHADISSEKVTDLAIDWLKNQVQGERPIFLFAHYFDPHNNYYHHPKFDRTSWYKGQIASGMDFNYLNSIVPSMSSDDKKALRGFYDEEVSFTDHNIGRLLDYLEEAGIRDETLIIFTADHGEELSERGAVGHTKNLYDELTRVPLVFNLPSKIKSRRVPEPVSTIDIFPTVLGMLGKESKVEMAGKDLSGIVSHSEEAPEHRQIFSEVDYNAGRIVAHKLSVVEGQYKLILDKDKKTYELFNLATDPKETKNLAQSEEAVLSRLSSAIKGFQARYQMRSAGAEKAETPKEESKDNLEQLKSLGYL